MPLSFLLYTFSICTLRLDIYFIENFRLLISKVLLTTLICTVDSMLTN